MDVHLGSEAEKAGKNHRNGHSKKTVLTDSSALELSIPRDRHGHFEPQLIEKYRRRFPGFDEKIIALYARGMSTRDIQAHVRELYGLVISPDLANASRSLTDGRVTHKIPHTPARTRGTVTRCATPPKLRADERSSTRHRAARICL